MSLGRRTQVLRTALASLMLAMALVPLAMPTARGGESLSELEARMEALQAELNAAQTRIEDLRTEQELSRQRMEEAEPRLELLRRKQEKLSATVVERARKLYMQGNSEMLEALFGSQDLTDLMDKTEVLSQVSLGESGAFVDLARAEYELAQLEEQWKVDNERLKLATARLAEENERLQARFEEVSDEYEQLQRQLTGSPTLVVSTGAPVGSGGMACPVAGAVSFIDSWGYPRSGHTHQGTDMMAAYGTPVVAITDGTITLSDYGGSAGYWIILSGDDGHQYWYMHNQQNLVSGGHVSAGQQIATVGDTGNAAGTPHVHFEYHPGGGAAINPYPLVASVC
ncbi:MAG: peptidoglycan DD-metalloendopeptidase family protein [Actinomycetota bacterium]|nr:peptidoglycan DD-metalloendopeptidase family protein [Actinomycetota bacterium]